MQTPDVTETAAPTIGETLAKLGADDSRLFLAIVATQIAAVFMCSQAWLVPVLSWKIIGFVWAYNILWMIVQDVIKHGLYCILDPAQSWKRSLFEPLRVSVRDTQKAVR